MKRFVFKILLAVFSALIVGQNLFAQSSKKTLADDIQNITTWQAPQFSIYPAKGYTVDTFKVPEGLKKDVDFWIKVYTQYSTQQGVFHVAGDTEVILGEIDLTQVYANQKWSAIRKELESEILIKRQKRNLAAKYKIDIKKIRLQMGLKDRMLEAIKISGRYFPMIEKIFESEGIPKELSRIVFVESSFNIYAQSSVGASGLWQIMPRVSKKYKYMSKSQDLRNHPFYSTQLAAVILKENYAILKSWPLAVTAYNHGVGSMRKVIKKFNSNDIAYLVNNSNSKKGLGFASKNFYSTFLAALHVESHANIYFPEPVYKYKELETKQYKIKKVITYDQLLTDFDSDKELLRFYNPHLNTKLLKSGQKIPLKTVVNFPKKQNEKLAEENASADE